MQKHSILILISILLLSSAFAQTEKPALKVGDVAPVFSLPDLKNNYVFLRDYSGEKLRKPWKNKIKYAVVMSFFATWCGPCIKEIPYLEILQKEFKDKSVKFFLVDVGEERAKLDQFLSKNEIGLNILHDRYQQTSEKYGANSLPRLIVIDKEGIVQLVKRGFKDGDSFLTELRSLVSKLLL